MVIARVSTLETVGWHVRIHFWDVQCREEAEVYPTQRNSRLAISEEQKRALALFG